MTQSAFLFAVQPESKFENLFHQVFNCLLTPDAEAERVGATIGARATLG